MLTLKCPLGGGESKYGKKSIDWENLLKKRPDVLVWLQAKSVRTSLVGLNKHQINDLIHCAEWMTELQIKTYLPNLL